MYLGLKPAITCEKTFLAVHGTLCLPTFSNIARASVMPRNEKIYCKGELVLTKLMFEDHCIFTLNGVFTLPDSDSYTNPYYDSYETGFNNNV